MQNSTAVSSAGPGRVVSHADASDPAQLRKRARSARAADRTCEEVPFASASSVAKGAAVRASASAWEGALFVCRVAAAVVWLHCGLLWYRWHCDVHMSCSCSLLVVLVPGCCRA